MLEKATDAVQVPVSEDQVMKLYGIKDVTDFESSTVPAVDVVNTVVPLNFCVGCLTPALRRLMMKAQLLRPVIQSRQSLAKIVIAAVSKRLSSDVTRNDFMAHLVAARDDQGKPLSQQELTSEAATLLVAGSNTIATSVS